MKKLLIILGAIILLSCKKNDTNNPVSTNGNIPSLSKGVNLSNWFNDYSDPGQYTTRFSVKTLELIKNSGFNNVRIPIGSTILFNAADPLQLNVNGLVYVNLAVSRCINAGLAVTINLHPLLNNIDSLLSNNPAFADKIAGYWKSLAGFFKKYPADKIIFEVYNEPHASAAGITTQDYTWWQSVQGKIITAIREETKEHYIIVGGEGWNSINGLLQLTPYNDSKVIYDFHFYDPFFFTHQGATWSGWQPAIDARNVPYPSSPEAVAPVIAATTNIPVKDALRWYGDQRYNIDSIDKWIKRAFDWGQSNHVKVIANEFGSYMTYAPRQSRLNWIHDVRTVLEKYRIGWAMWDCDDGFGWINYSGNDRNNPIVDTEVLTALGLK